ncbi:MAG TPA: nuclear transport factor 2 family protein [Phnomibacter sp.]|nr:nuclear transport factor 2 family protein [Phnomibacter sp.]
MKRIGKFIPYFLIVAAMLTLTLQATCQSKDEIAVAKAVEEMRLAMISGDRAALERVPAEKLSYGHSSGAVDDHKSFVEKIASGQSDFVTIELKDQTISVSKKAAIVRHELHAKTNDNGNPGEVHLRVLLVFEKQNGKWKLLARQAVRMT